MTEQQHPDLSSEQELCLQRDQYLMLQPPSVLHPLSGIILSSIPQAGSPQQNLLLLSELEALRDQGLMVIATQPTHEDAEQLLRQIGVVNFENIISFAPNELGINIQRNSEAFYSLLYKSLMIPPPQLLVIGNTLEEVEPSVKVGMAGVIIKKPQARTEIINQILSHEIYREETVRCVIKDAAGNVLLQQNPNDISIYKFPGGVIDEMEKLIPTEEEQLRVIKGIEQETGLDILSSSLQELNDSIYKSKGTRRIHLFQATILTIHPEITPLFITRGQPNDIPQYTWIPENELIIKNITI